MSLSTSILTAGANNFGTTSEHINNLAKDLITPGVIGPIVNNIGAGSTGGFGLDAQGTPDNTISVRAGVAYVSVTPSSQRPQLLRVEALTNQTITITPNVGALAYDWVYIKVDTTLANTPDVNGTTVSTLYVSRSNNSSTDTGIPPTTFLLLGVITVNTSWVTITNSVIAGRRVQTSLTAQQAWVTPTMLNSWVAYDVGGGTNFGGAQYYKDSLGMVHLRGLVKNGTITTGTSLFNLPAGYRPSQTTIFVTNSNNAFARVDCMFNGDVTINLGASAVFISLNNIHFRAEA